MATTLSNIVCSCQLSATETKTEQGKNVSVQADQFTFALSLTAGTASDKANVLYTETDRALTSGQNDDLDVYDLAVFDQTTDLLGNTITFTEIVAICVRNQSGSAGNLLLGGISATTAWNSMFNGDDDAVLNIHPGGLFLLSAPDDPAYAVADTSNHLLRVNASGGNITYDIAILGRNA
jgi:hypothetical protein